MSFDPDSFEGLVLTKLGGIEEKLKAIPDHEKRLRWLERIAWGLAGAWLLVTAWLEIHISGGK